MRIVRNEGGVTAVEFALVLPVLIMLTIGMFTGGIAFHNLLSLDHAAREGARFGATYEVKSNGAGQDWNGYLDAVVAETIDATHWIENDPSKWSAGEFVCVAWIPDPEVGGSPQRRVVGGGSPQHATRCFDDARSEARVQVLVGRDTDLNAIFYRRDLELRSKAVARYERG